jgi:nitrogen fixation NifU-like protein
MADDLRELYQEVILDHGKRPRNFRHPADANREAHGNNPLCGDRLVVFLKVDDQGVIQDAAFEGRGCAISTASASMMTEMLKGKTAGQAQRLFDAFHHMCTTDSQGDVPADLADDLEKLQVLSGVRQFPMRVKCATLAWHTMNAAMAGQTETSTE